MRRADFMRAGALGLAAPVWVAWGGSARVAGSAAHAAMPADGDGTRGLVDAVFRDAALRVLRELAIHAPGQSADGAVQAHHSAGHVDPQGQAWQYVSAYPANLAFVGALRIAPDLSAEAGRWLAWQARHLALSGPARGVVFDHWVRVADLQESDRPPGSLHDRPVVDAFDSTAASLLLLADAYAQAVHGSPALLHEPPVRAALEAAAGALAALTQRDGLSWAKPDHQVAYLMDAVEVAAGWRAWARLQANVYRATGDAETSLAAAARTDAAMLRHLWDAPRQSWRVELGAPPADFSRWYPDSVAQAWPMLWQHALSPAIGALGQTAWRRAAGHWHEPAHWAERNVDPAGFWWPAVAVAARCAGDTAGARAWVARARRAWLDPALPFGWPFQVGDLCWLFRLAEPLTGKPPAS